MRPKIVLGFVILPTVIVILAIFTKLRSEKPIVSPGLGSTNLVAVLAPKAEVATVFNAPVQTPISNPIPTAPVKELSAEERQNQIYTEIDRLNNAYAVRDEASKALITADLTNSEPEVRAAAVEATKQLGDRSLIPVLQDLATNTTDYEEHHALLAAAEFLSLPTMEEAENTWTPGPNAIPASSAQQRRHHPNHSAPPTATAPDNSANPAADQPNETAPATGN